MKLKVDQVFEAMVTLTQIIRDKRKLPLRGSYHLARLHAKLQPDFEVISAKRDEVIKSFGVHNKIRDPRIDPLEYPAAVPMVDGPDFIVPPELQGEFVAKWKVIGDEEIEIDVQPVSLDSLDLGPTIPGELTAIELCLLGELIKE